MFLAWPEIWRNRLRFGLVVLISALLTVLLLMLSGLSNGLAEANVGAVRKMPVDFVLFESGVKYSLIRSALPPAAVRAARRVPGFVAASPLGYAIVTAKLQDDDEPFDASLFGVDPQGMGMPPIVSGRPFRLGNHREVVVDQSMVTVKGVRLGDRITVRVAPGKSVSLTVVGISDNRPYGHFPSLFGSLTTWEEVHFSSVPGFEAGGNPRRPVSAVLVQSDGRLTAEGLRRGLAAQGLRDIDAADHDAAYRHSPGYKEEQASIKTQQGFMWVIGVIMMGAFFYTLTLQNLPQIGVLKALGATNGLVARVLVLQSALVTGAGILAGAGLTLVFSRLIPPSVPMHFTREIVVGTMAALLLMGPLGAVFSLRRLLKVDPLTALNLF